jgi:hypothetical protein
MWFDPYAKLAEIAGQSLGASAGQAPKALAVSQLSQVSQRLDAPSRTPCPPARADGLDPDAGAYLDWLRLHGSATYGAMTFTLGWGATRAWRAEAMLRASGTVRLDHWGRAVIEGPHGP